MSLLRRRMTAILLGLALASSAAAEPRIELELVSDRGFPITGAHEWIEALKDVGVTNLRIRPARGGERPEVEASGSGDSAIYRVTGILSSGNQLVLPTGRFRMSDRAGISKWLESLKAGGVEELAAPRTAFGLTEREFLDLHEKLAVPIAFSTKDQSAYESIKTIVRALPVRVDLDAGSRAALEADWQVPEEMQGMSRGTAMAAMLRPLGLAFAPQRQPGGRVSLKIGGAGDLQEAWPVGWPSDRNLAESAPNMLKFLNVEIADTPVTEIMSAIQGRLEMPFLYDHNALARERIDPAAVNASVPAGNTYYKLIVRRVLFQAKLEGEVLLDDGGKPFLWITTIRKP